jgi:hypothetical protein
MQLLLEILTRDMQSSVTQVFEQEISHDQQNKENEAETDCVLATEKHYKQVRYW